MTSTSPSRDPDIINSMKALQRAARAARKLSIETGTPFYIWRDGKVVDLNRPKKRATKPKRTTSATPRSTKAKRKAKVR
jgi:hypothetical protein